MDPRTEQVLTALLAREGLEPREGDLEAFAEVIELYIGNLKTLWSLELTDDEPAPVFHPEGIAR